MNRIINANALVFFTMTACLFTMIDNYFGGGTFKTIALAMDVMVIVWAFLKTSSQYFFRNITPVCLFAIIIVIVNTCFTPYTEWFSWLLKYIGYFVFFVFGKYCGTFANKLKCNKYLLYFMILSPLLIVFLFDKTDMKNMFFPNSNCFVYWGICMSVAYMLLNEHTNKNIKIAWGILFAYVLVGTSLGILAAIFLSVLLLNYKRVNPILLLVIPILAIFCVLYIDIPVFERIRDVFRVFQAISFEELINPQNVNFYELAQDSTSSGRTDNASFLWRILQWTTLFNAYILDIIHIPFGMGLEWSTDFTGLPPHNDYLKILVEYGCVFFTILILGLKKVYNVINSNRIIYFILPIFIYHFTENLLGNFPQNVFFYIALGYYYSLNKFKNENIIS